MSNIVWSPDKGWHDGEPVSGPRLLSALGLGPLGDDEDLDRCSNGCVCTDDDGAVPPDPDDPEMQDDPVAQEQYWRDVDLDNKGRRENLS